LNAFIFGNLTSQVSTNIFASFLGNSVLKNSNSKVTLKLNQVKAYHKAAMFQN